MVSTDHAHLSFRRVNKTHAGPQSCSYRQTGHYNLHHLSDHMLQTSHQHCDTEFVSPQEPAAISPPLLDAPANRVSTLTPASIQFLTDVGAWQEIAPPRSAPFSRMQVWDNVGGGFIQYNTAHLSEATMGHVAENGVIQHALMQRLLPNVDRIWPVSAGMFCVHAMLRASGPLLYRCHTQ